MPFTPYHFGPGLLIKSVFRKKFSLGIFILTQILIDFEVIWNLLKRNDRLHTFFHSYIGSCVVIIIAVIFAYFSRYLLKKSIYLKSLFSKFISSDSKPFFFSAIIGAWSHVFLDSLMHADMTPLYPFSASNFFLNQISLLSLHLGCVLSGGIGAVIWVGAKFIEYKQP